jgi:putative ABC transport system permease protein
MSGSPDATGAADTRGAADDYWPAPGAWRVAARLARREVRRRPGRTALVAALVAVPVAGMLLGVVFLRTQELSDAEVWHMMYGRADAVVFPDTSATPAPLPEGSRAVEYTTVERVVSTADGFLCRCSLSDLPFDPLTDGIVRLTAGRPPADLDEVVLSRPAAEALHAGLGDRIELVQPLALDATVVGLGATSEWIDDARVVVGPGTPLPAELVAEGGERLVDLPDGLPPDQVAAWEATAGAHSMAPGFPGASSVVLAGDNAQKAIRGTWVAGAIGLTVLGIVIAAAFASSARRQLATLGQLAANGGTPAQLRRVLFLQGTVTGVVGSVAGLGLGAALLAAARSEAPGLVDHAVSGWDVRALDALPIVLLAVAAATVAALVPAGAASRVSVLSALAGRRPLGRVSRRWTAAGLVMATAGLVMLGVVGQSRRNGLEGSQIGSMNALAVAGPVLLLLGVCAATPAYVSVLRPVAAGLRGPWRLAARSLFRQRTRTSAMVAAIGAISAVAVAGAAVGLAAERTDRSEHTLEALPRDFVRVEARQYYDDLIEVEPPAGVLDDAADRAAAILPGAERYTISDAVAPGPRSKPVIGSADVASALPAVPDQPSVAIGLGLGRATIADDQFRAAYGLDAVVRHELDEVGAVWFGAVPGRATLEATSYPLPLPPPDPNGNSLAEVLTGDTVSFEAAIVEPEHGHGYGTDGELLLTPQKADELGWTPAPTEVVFRTPGPLTGAQRDAVDDLVLAAEATQQRAAADPDQAALTRDLFVRLYYEGPRLDVGPGLIETVPTAIALAFALLVLAEGLALAAVETSDERDVLAALGAAPRTLRRTSGTKAFLLTVLGGAIALPVGLLPVAVVGRLGDSDSTVVFPWTTVALLLVAVPVVAALVTSTATRAALRFRPVRVSTATFE